MKSLAITRYCEGKQKIWKRGLRGIFGTDIVDTFGDPQEEIIVKVDAEKLAALNLTIGDVARATDTSDAKVSAGGLHSDNSEAVVEVESEFTSLADIGQRPIKTVANDRVVKLSDVATIDKGIAKPFNNLVIIENKKTPLCWVV